MSLVRKVLPLPVSSPCHHPPPQLGSLPGSFILVVFNALANMFVVYGSEQYKALMESENVRAQLDSELPAPSLGVEWVKPDVVNTIRRKDAEAELAAFRKKVCRATMTTITLRQRTHSAAPHRSTRSAYQYWGTTAQPGGLPPRSWLTWKTTLSSSSACGKLTATTSRCRALGTRDLPPHPRPRGLGTCLWRGARGLGILSHWWALPPPRSHPPHKTLLSSRLKLHRGRLNWTQARAQAVSRSRNFPRYCSISRSLLSLRATSLC